MYQTHCPILTSLDGDTKCHCPTSFSCIGPIYFLFSITVIIAINEIYSAHFYAFMLKLLSKVLNIPQSRAGFSFIQVRSPIIPCKRSQWLLKLP